MLPNATILNENQSSSADQSGKSVSISADGNTAVKGIPMFNSGVGAAMVYFRWGIKAGILKGYSLTSS